MTARPACAAHTGQGCTGPACAGVTPEQAARAAVPAGAATDAGDAGAACATVTDQAGRSATTTVESVSARPVEESGPAAVARTTGPS